MVDRIESEILKIAATQARPAVFVCVNLQNFKSLNIILGYQRSDQFLGRVQQRLTVGATEAWSFRFADGRKSHTVPWRSFQVVCAPRCGLAELGPGPDVSESPTCCVSSARSQRQGTCNVAHDRVARLPWHPSPAAQKFATSTPGRCLGWACRAMIASEWHFRSPTPADRSRENDRHECHKQFAAGVFMKTTRETLEEPWQATPESPRPRSPASTGAC